MVNQKLKPTILIFGAAGQVGFQCSKDLACLGNVVTATRDRCDLCDLESVRRTIDFVKPQIIVNAAAYTNVDGAENNRAIAFAVNGLAAGTLAEMANKYDCLLIHISTDYVFDGKSENPYDELHTPNPINVYGESKLDGELRISKISGKFFILRTSWVYSADGKNFIQKIIQLAQKNEILKIVADQFGSPTSSKLISRIIKTIIQRYLSDKIMTENFGLYHISAAGKTNWYNYAKNIIENCHRNSIPVMCQVENLEKIRSNEFITLAKRPKNSYLSCNKFEIAFNTKIDHWHTGVREVIKEIAEEKYVVKK